VARVPSKNQMAFPDFGVTVDVPGIYPPGRAPGESFDLDAFDLDQLVEDLYTANMDASSVIVDEMNDLPKPKNVVEWVLDSRFLAQEPYAKQIEILLNLREDYCPECSDRDYVQAIPTDAKVEDILERATLLDCGVCPKCKKDRRDFKAAGLFHTPREMVLVTGQRSGKTTLVAYDWSYSLQRLVSLPDPARMYRVIKGQFLQSLFTAITAKQAYETLWVQAMAVFDNAPWFSDLAKLLTQKGREIGKQLYQKEKTFVAFWNKNVVCTFGPAEGGSQRGRTRWYTATDEWGWFAKSATETRRKIRGNEDDIYTALTRSLLTIRAGGDRLRETTAMDAPTGIMANIGSPYSMQDKGMRLLRERAKDPRTVCRHYSTFEMNPTVRPEDIDATELASTDGQRDYYAIPPMAVDPFFEDPKAVTSAMDLNRRSQLEAAPETLAEEIPGSDQLRHYVYAKIRHWPRDRFVPRILALDAGESFASFGVVLAHVDRELRTVVDGAIEIQPVGGSSVHFPSVFQHVIEFLIDQLNIKFLVADRWQSTDFVQRARLKGVMADRRMLKANDFRDFKGRFITGKVRLPAPEIDPLRMAEGDPRACVPYPNAHLALQTMTVRRVGEKVVKPQNGFDDLFRCLVLADVVVEDHRREMASEVNEYGMPQVRTVGVFAGLSLPNEFAGASSPRADRPQIGFVGGVSNLGRGGNSW
jgi:hypothetical protein